MNKPTHAFAALLWLLAVVYLIVDPTMVTVITAEHSPAFGGADYSYLRFIWVTARSVLLDVALIASMGFVIELLDHLRWLATPVDERAAMGSRYLLDRLRRSRMH